MSELLECMYPNTFFNKTDSHSPLFSHEHGSNHEKWQIAAVGETKYVIICRETGMYVCAIGISHQNLGVQHPLTDTRDTDTRDSQTCQV